MRISWSRGRWAAAPAALAGGWAMAMGQLSSSGGCWGSDVTGDTARKQGRKTVELVLI